MRLPNTAHTSRPWRIHELTGDFRLEDVWALPTPGGRDDFRRLVQWWASRGDPSRASASRAVRTLWAIRWKAGELLGWDGPDAGPGSERPTLRDRLPADLREAPPGPDFAALPFTSLYLTGDEWAAEIVNRTVHGVMHLGWVPDGTGGYRGQMAVLVKPNGLLGTGYMAAIRPFRHLIVYPPMLREIGRGWRALPGDPAPDLPVTAPGTSVKEEIDVTAGTDSHPNDRHVEALGLLLPAAMLLYLAGVLEGVEVLRQRRRGTDRSLVTSGSDRDRASMRLLALTWWPVGIVALAAAAGPHTGRPSRAHAHRHPPTAAPRCPDPRRHRLAAPVCKWIVS